MKRTYTPKLDYWLLFCIASAFSLGAVASFIIFMFVRNDSFAAISSLICFSIFGAVFWFGTYIVSTQKIIVDEGSITFHFRIITEPRVKYDSKNGLKINFTDIEKISCYLHFGDWIFTADTRHYHIELKNGTQLSFTLFRFMGKNKARDFFLGLQYLINERKKQSGNY